MAQFSLEDQLLIEISWPGGVAEQCSRHRGKGAHCLSVASLRAAGVGEPHRCPEELAPAEAGGHSTANNRHR